MDRFPFGTETREVFSYLLTEIVHAIAESIINFIACTVFEAHRTGHKDDLKDFVLEKLEGPDWPLDPMPKLPRMTSAPLPPDC
jgi:hypothetical protein